VHVHASGFCHHADIGPAVPGGSTRVSALISGFGTVTVTGRDDVKPPATTRRRPARARLFLFSLPSLFFAPVFDT
jgi:hypothetical protein